ncbi:hypothetical protein [Flavobacterium salmonis]|uniref:MoxR-vWA-beta-propeller ternary system domain-containing protein n=1 Tax=Flavobacterium salmonis TaxID=2654844 RepID=A0A6V6Z004_9FLAO|nr:hypothetical protein [Flavobacterium salmonis]CAD0004252.1 hypothetical protein FLAT13_02146 [Flavobacterium salmonis]
MYFLEIKIEHKDFLGGIRHWDNLKVAFETDTVWIRDFSSEQINSAEIQQIPYKIVYEWKENLLFEKDKLLPSKKLPSGLLWSPILRALPVSLPKFNHNYFGIDQRLEMNLKPSENVKLAFAMLVSFEELKLYIESAPKYRLEPLKWVVIDKRILLFGFPLLPVKGSTFWMNHDFLLPTGYDFEWFSLTGTFQEKLNPSKENLILWNEDNSYSVIPKETIKPLSISSFRLTFS